MTSPGRLPWQADPSRRRCANRARTARSHPMTRDAISGDAREWSWPPDWPFRR
jgi:hypothetical protein